MTSVHTTRSSERAFRSTALPELSPTLARAVFLAVIAATATLAFVASDVAASSQAVAQAGDDLTRLLRLMALIKLVLVAGAVGGILWRLGAAVRPGWFAAYTLACGAMAAGPGLIWTMVHVGLGALLLHGGLLASVLLLWRDPAVAGRLATALAARRRAAPRA